MESEVRQRRYVAAAAAGGEKELTDTPEDSVLRAKKSARIDRSCTGVLAVVAALLLAAYLLLTLFPDSVIRPAPPIVNFLVFQVRFLAASKSETVKSVGKLNNLSSPAGIPGGFDSGFPHD